MKVSIHTIEKTIFEGEADSVTLPGIDGELGILNDHIPLVSSLTRGNVVVRKGRDVQQFPINGGFAEVQPESNIVILAN